MWEKLVSSTRLGADNLVAGTSRWRLMLVGALALTLVVGAYAYGALSRSVTLTVDG